MTDHVTMQAGELTVRKTEEGWQYLSEGFNGEPDMWYDATDILGPFGGNGVNNLLDELLALKEQAAQNSSKVCQNCKHWKDGICDFIDTIDGEHLAKTTGCEVIATAHDDSGLYAVLKTAPNFSCPNFNH